jgi:sensor histidine kinase YesM
LGILKIRQIRSFLILSLFLIALVVVTAILMNRQSKLKAEQELLTLEQRLFRLQLNPHFMFNALNVIQSCTNEKDYSLAKNLLTGFSRLMRLILESSEKDLIPISEELEMIEHYLNIQKKRYPGIFEYEIIKSSGLETDILVPPMMLQPFIENAIEHGLRPLNRKGVIIISIQQAGGELALEVADNGIGRINSRRKASPYHKSMATEITARRFNYLEKKHKKRFGFTIEDANSTDTLTPGTKALFILPDDLKWQG